MTATSFPAGPTLHDRLRPLPWRRMGWVTWRQHRVALSGVAALLGAWAAYLWYRGAQAHHAYAAVAACHPAGSYDCGALATQFDFSYGDPALHAAVLLQVVPALIGAFVGAPVLARELETGTFRYTWTQGFGRRRWAIAKLTALAVAVTAAAGVFSLLFSWYYQPFIADGHSSTFLPEVFDLRGVAFAAWTLVAFAIGALAGILIRRVVPAVAVTLAAYAGLALTAGVYLRRHYLTPLLTSTLPPAHAWILSQWATKGGRFAFAGHVPPSQLLPARCIPSPPPGLKVKPSAETVARCLTQHGYTLWTRYQPAGRFWAFQGIEAAWLCALSILLLAATVWLVRRRAT